MPYKEQKKVKGGSGMWSTEDSLELPWVDFSKASRVRESLRQSLLVRRNRELSFEELDLVTAAGLAHPSKDNRVQ